MTKQGPVVIKDGAKSFRFHAEPAGKRVNITMVEAPNTRMRIAVPTKYVEAICEQLRSAAAAADALSQYERTGTTQ